MFEFDVTKPSTKIVIPLLSILGAFYKFDFKRRLEILQKQASKFVFVVRILGNSSGPNLEVGLLHGCSV